MLFMLLMLFILPMLFMLFILFMLWLKLLVVDVLMLLLLLARNGFAAVCACVLFNGRGNYFNAFPAEAFGTLRVKNGAFAMIRCLSCAWWFDCIDDKSNTEKGKGKKNGRGKHEDKIMTESNKEQRERICKN